MDSKVVIIKDEAYSYPNMAPFRPSTKYPETPFLEIAKEPNLIYGMVRSGFQMMGYDPENYGTKNWNPLGNLIIPGNTVVLKPNMVMDVNGIEENGTDCLYTQPSVVAAVLDYVIIALKGNGTIIIGDAPMQQCDFERLINKSGYRELIRFLHNKLIISNISIRLVDFRELRTIVRNNIYYSTTNGYEYSGVGAKIVDLGDDSEFANQNKYTYDNIRISDYDPSLLKSHHNAKIHEYKVSAEILSADVIINIPKPKTHRKGGVTISLKNLVGINCRKEYLPHHTNGSVAEGGDEYLNKSLSKRIMDLLLDKRNYHMQTTKNYDKVKFYYLLIWITNIFVHMFRKDSYHEGSWYGNDTISRTIIDLNKILIYADKEGCMKQTPQRKVIIVADMIISGEKEGPVRPSPKNVGMIIMGEDPVCFDETIATLMGAKINNINSIKRARNLKGIYHLTELKSRALLISNANEYNNVHLEQIKHKHLLYFVPAKGWEPAFKNY